MKLTAADAERRLGAHDHGTLGTVHAQRGVDLVPVVYAWDPDGFVGVPVDRVKPKSSTHLQRERNLALDPRASLLVEHWDRADWSALWWVRAELRKHDDVAAVTERLAARLAERFEQYRDRPFDALLVLRVVTTSGWSAGS